MSEPEISISPEQNTDWLITIGKHLDEAGKVETPEAWDEVCIHRVPRKLRDVNPSAFDPQIVSIGPYHRGKDVLRDMDIHKWRCFRRILIRNNQGASLYFDSITEVIEQAKRCYEGNINLPPYEWVETMVLDGCFLLEILFGFSEGVEYFAEMGYSRNDPVYSKCGPIEVMKEDMLKLENQRPLFILGRLLGLISNEEEDKTDLVTKKLLELFELQEKILEMEHEDFRSCYHCLHIYRCGVLCQFQPYPSPTQGACCAHRCICVHRWWDLCTRLVGPVYHLCTQMHRCLVGTEVSIHHVKSSAFAEVSPDHEEVFPSLNHVKSSAFVEVSSQCEEERMNRSEDQTIIRWGKIKKHPTKPREEAQKPSTHQQETIQCATKLREAGVKFKKRETHCFLDIKYEAGVLYIPQLVLDDTIKRQIHNLIAFEQTYHDPENRHEITSYAVFMDDLIDTSADVAYLHDHGIIDPFAGGSYDDAADFFNQITDGVIFDKEGDRYLGQATKGLLKKINDYHNSRIRNMMVGTKRKYFSNPWSIISLIAAIALLVLTFLQTFYGMYGYYRPRN